MNYLYQIIETVPSAALMVDKSGRVIKSNRAAEKLFEGRLTGQLWSEIINSSETFSDVKRVSASDITTLPTPDQESQIIFISENSSSSSQFENRAKLSELGKMIAKLAHQIKTPIASMFIHIDQVKRNSGSCEIVQKHIGKIQENARSVNDQVNEILQYSQGNSQKIEKIYLDELLTSALESISMITKKKGAQIVLEKDVPKVELICHKSSLVGSIHNILNNAIEASTQKCRITMAVKKLGHDAVRISIKDNGPGMDERTLKKARSAFYTTKSEGTGLGLAVVDSVMAAHGGNMTLTSQMGLGTCVDIELPVEKRNNKG